MPTANEATARSAGNVAWRRASGAAVALGELTFDQVPGRVGVTRSYQPDPALQELYDRLFREFVGLYRRNRKAYARLNREQAGT